MFVCSWPSFKGVVTSEYNINTRSHQTEAGLRLHWVWVALVWLGGVWCAQRLTSLPRWWVLGVLLAIALSALSAIVVLSARIARDPGETLRWQRRYGSMLLLFLLLIIAGVVGLIWASSMANQRMHGGLPVNLDNSVSLATFEVVGYPSQSGVGVNASVRVTARVIATEQLGLPEYFQLNWRHACVRDCPFVVVPGQQWQAMLRWRLTASPLNFYGDDKQGRLLQQGVLVNATVRGQPRFVGMADSPSWQSRLSGLRLHIAERMKSALHGLSWAGVVVALAIGDQYSMSPQQWAWFSRTGVSHLVSISGTHVGLLASMLGWLVCFAFKRLRVRPRRDPAAVPASLMQWLPS